MEYIVQLTELLTAIKAVSKQIIIKTLDLMEDLRTEDNDMVDDLVENHPDLNPKEALKLLRGAAEAISYTPHKIIQQIDTFTHYLLEGKEQLAEHISEYDYLAEVWYGDLYDNTEGIDGLRELFKELRTKYEKDILPEKLIMIAEKNLKK